MDINRVNGLVVILLLLISTSAYGGKNKDQPVSNETLITFIHFNDLHAHLTPYQDRILDDASPGSTKIETVAGLARTATVIKQIREESPNNILMNIGDTFHGGAEALFTGGNAIVKPINKLNIDVGVPGNWDFAYGNQVTRDRFDPTLSSGDIEKPNYPNLGANVAYSGPLLGDGEFLPATWVTQRAGVTIGVIGLTSDMVEEMHSSFVIGFDFAQGMDEHLSIVEQHALSLRNQGAKIVVVMSELGIHKDWYLAKQLESGLVDIFFSAHTHETTFEPLVAANGTWVVEAGNATYLGRLDFTLVDNEITDKQWQLLTLTSDIEPDKEMAKLIDDVRKPFLDEKIEMEVPHTPLNHTINQPINTVIGVSTYPVDRRHALESSFNNAITAVMRNQHGTDIALSPGFRFDSPLQGYYFDTEEQTWLNDEITLEDIYRYFPVIYEIATGTIRGDQLKENIEEGLTSVYSPTIFNQSGGWLLGMSGLDITVDLANSDGNRVTALADSDTGATISNNTIVSATGCVRPMEDRDILCSYDGFSDIETVRDPATGNNLDIINFFTQAVANGQFNVPETDNIHDQNNTPSWPESPFVQPLEGVQ